MRRYPTYAEFSPLRKAYTQAMLVFWIMAILFDTRIAMLASVVTFIVWWTFCSFVESKREAWERALRRNEDRWPPPPPPRSLI